MGDARKIPFRQDPLTAPERMLVVACTLMVVEGVGLPPLASRLVAAQVALPHLRADAQFAALASAAARVLDAEHDGRMLPVRMGQLREALMPILDRDFRSAGNAVQALGLNHAS